MTAAKLTIIVGLPASGKTMMARSYVAMGLPAMRARLLTAPPRAEVGGVIRVNRDDLRAMAHGGWTGIAAAENQITVVQQAAVGALLQARCQVIVDDTNLWPEARRAWRELAAEHGARFEVWDLTAVDLQTCLDRNAERTGAAHVPADKIVEMHEKYIVPLGGRRVLEAEPWLKCDRV